MLLQVVMIVLLAILIVLVLYDIFGKTDQEGRRQYQELSAKLDNNAALSAQSIQGVQTGLSQTLRSMGSMLGDHMERIDRSVTGNMQSTARNLADVSEKLDQRMIDLLKENAGGQEKMIRTLTENLDRIQHSTEEKLTGIQNDVNKKLDISLNKRLDESFEKVSTQLSELYKSLGELSEMSDGISSLNKTLSNVKTRGTWGEIQLGSILEETMQEGQFVRNIKLRKDSDDMVEFAVRIPSKEDSTEVIYLPIDSKFPVDRYNCVVDASATGDKEALDKAVRELAQRIKEEARTIRDKYIVPPVTTDFAIMFLPTEAMYAEVLRINGLAEYCQNNYRVVISGPSTITALLNSLRIGFANLALNKKTAEVRKMLQAVKTQYGKLDELIEQTRKKLDAAVVSTDRLKERTAKIQKSMSKIDVLESQEEADRLLEIRESQEDADGLSEI